jgi:hypothetical protein
MGFCIGTCAEIDQVDLVNVRDVNDIGTSVLARV